LLSANSLTGAASAVASAEFAGAANAQIAVGDFTSLKRIEPLKMLDESPRADDTIVGGARPTSVDPPREAKIEQPMGTGQQGQDVVPESGPPIDAPRGKSTRKVPRRTPDLEKSRQRLAYFNAVATELATIKQSLDGHCTTKSLKQMHPRFLVWKRLSKREIEEIAAGQPFYPKAFAENLTLREFGITSRETLKKDRQKIRRAQSSR
jgi:hypothetical protein